MSMKVRPRCHICNEPLEVEDVIDTSVSYYDETYTELTIGVCPKCNHTYQYTQIYSLRPIDYDDLEDITENEED